MKGDKITLDFSDFPEILTVLSQLSAQKRTSPESIIKEALVRYFDCEIENSLFLQASKQTFSEWASEEDAVYDEM